MTDAATPPDQIPGAPHPRETAQLFGQSEAQQEFLAAFASGRIHSGWLLCGPRGIGKATLAWKIATFLLAQPVDTGDGLFGAPPPATSLEIPPDHPDARLVAAGAHPRLSLLRRPVDDKTGLPKIDIPVDAVRALKGFFHMSAADGGRRVVIVDSADEMNRAAANALLKELEEPPAHTTLLLISHQPSGLLPTIRSRCRTLRCASLAPADLAAALDQAGVTVDQPDALAALSAGSAGDAVRLLSGDGLALYASLVSLLSDLPNVPRAPLIKLADSCAGRQNEARFALLLDLIDRLLSRAARAGLMGEPDIQAALGEARLLSRLSPHDHAARAWADVQQTVSARMRRGKAVNLDPAALILDTVFAIEQTARSIAAP